MEKPVAVVDELVEEQTQTPTPEEVEADQAFETGFTGKPPESTESQETLPTETTATEKPPTAPATETPSATPPEPKYVQITEEQLQQFQALATAMPEIKAALGKLRDDAFGRVGGVERTLKELQAATPSGDPVVVSEEDFEELKAQGFPELASFLVKDLNRILSKGKVKGTATAPAAAIPAPPVVDPVKVEEIVKEHISVARKAIKEETATQVTTQLRPDWATVVGLPGPNGEAPPNTAFRQWLAKQTTEYQHALDASWNPADVLTAIEKFEQDTKPAPAAPDPRKQRIAAAVQPKSAPAVHQGAKTEDDHFADGFEGR